MKNLNTCIVETRVEFFFPAGEKVRDEGGGRILLGDNRRRGRHAATYQVPVCWSSLDFIWTPLYVHV